MIGSQSEAKALLGTAWHVKADELNRRLGYASGAVTPVGSVVPDFIGQVYRDTVTNNWYVAKGLTSADWTGYAAASRKIQIPICGNAKVGATAGWVITAGTNIGHATLPASQTTSTLVIPISGLAIGDIVTAVDVCGQVESAGGSVTLTMDVRKLTNAAADNADASLGTDNVGTLAADTILSSANLGVTGLTEVMAENESLYVLLVGTTAASTDIDLTHLVVTITPAP